ncbi:unnamed protein product [Rhizoctonia solani]|uniref:Transmembrane protein n=1 Tax=Rhizoctonia solani TaxID=456999 RepID=A0A8H2WQM3_9AGAM|nr:unnamed protein product [Rhizoctonia solani]
MSPVFNDKFDMLMNIKRQVPSTTESAPTESISNTSTSAAAASPTTSSAAPTPTTTSALVTTSAAPTTTSASLSTSTTPTTTLVPITTSSTVSTTSATPTLTSTLVSTTSSTPVTSSTQSTSTPVTSSTAAVVTSTTPVVVITTTATPTTPTTRATSTTITSASTSSTRPAVSISSRSTVIVTTSNGQLVTATIVVSASETAAAAATKKSFFQNTGAVVGVFVVVGIVAMILLVVIGTVFLRRRRAKQFDLDVQEAAREAARAQAPIEDDDDYTGTSYNTHNSKPMSAEQRAYGYGATNASGWDPYARGAAPGGYEMQHRRASVVTSTTPGMAGFGAGDTFAREQGYGQQQGYNQAYAQPYAQGNQGYAQQQGYAPDGYNTGYGQGYGQQAHNPSNTSSGYNNTSPQQGYALAQEQPGQGGRAPVHAQMMMPDPQRHSYNNVGAFRQSPSYGEAHPGEQVQYGHAEPEDTSGQDGRYPSAPRMSEDPYGGYLPYDEPGPSTTSQAPSSNPPAYATGPSNVGATGDRKVARQPSGKSHETRYSRDDDESDEEPTRRVLKVANE